MVFVGGFSEGTTEREIRTLFETVGTVVFASIFSDKETGRSRGCGKVEFSSPALAQKAVEEFNDKELDGNRLRVKLMEARAPGEGPRVAGSRRENDGRQLFFDGLSPDWDTDCLREFLQEKVGGVTYANIFVDRETGRPKGVGKASFETLEFAEAAFRLMHGMEIEGKAVSVRRERAPQPDGRSVFVGGLSWDVGPDDLKMLGGQVGEVTFASVFYDKETGKHKGSGKIQFANVELAEAAVEELSGRQLLGREVSVRLMEARS